MKDFRKQKVWVKAHDLALEAYRVTEAFPQKELFGLTSQIRRAGVSIPANIAEGHGRDHLGDYVRHISTAKGCVLELETRLLIVERLKYLPRPELELAIALTAEVGKMLEGLSKSLRAIPANA